MFPRLPPQGESCPDLEQGLRELGSKMIATTDGGDPNNPPPMQGYTYLGQFIDHDLTFDLTPLDAATRDVEYTENFRIPFLDLDHVYGGGPNLSPFLYRSDSSRGAERFLIGPTRPKTLHDCHYAASPNDLPRNPEGIALAGDPREDENLIIAQLHVAFLKFHNRILDFLESGSIQNVGPDGATLFEQARRLVTWHYQWVVRHDYLQQILDEHVFEELADRNTTRGPDARTEFQIPVEFSVAAFRFGHSMVRNDYLINDQHVDASLRDDLLQLTGTPGTARRAAPNLPADWVIDWRFFFFIESKPHEVRHSSPIDTAIAEGLHHVSNQLKLFNAPIVGCSQSASAHQFQNKLEPRLPVITLLRGARVGLPSGQSVAKEINLPATRTVTDDEIAQGQHEGILRKYGFHKDTPLWYYVLKEAEVLKKGVRLGPIGSRIVADVLTKALNADPNSYLSINPNWTPSVPTQDSNPRMFTIADLLRFARSTRSP